MIPEQPSPRGAPILLGCLTGLVAMVALVAILPEDSTEKRPEPPQAPGEGKIMTIRGSVTGSGDTFWSGRPYFDVSDGQRSVTCQYVTGGPPPRGTWVTISGRAVVWSSAGGVFRPCVIVGR